MQLSKRYDPRITEPRLLNFWQKAGIYHFSDQDEAPVYSIDTPPPTVSGHLHLGNVFSYTHADLMARFWRMNGYNVFYPMGYDDNGLPTERLVEKQLGITAAQVGRRAFIEKCLQVSEEAEKDYQALWQRLGLSIDWRYTYRTIDERSRRISQLSFLHLYQKGLVYRRDAPAIWCPECRTAIAQAELNDQERASEYVTLDFRLEDPSAPRANVLIATTRPELLPACVAVFVHPEDDRYRGLAGQTATVPLFGQRVPILEDTNADPEKGTGVVMCCTFGDTTDVTWWYTHKLPLVEAVDQKGCMTEAAGKFSGLPSAKARVHIKRALEEASLLLDRQPTNQSVRVHERCDTTVEYIVARQWFINLLDYKEELLQAGAQVRWHPDHMQARYRNWVENLKWDWCISRQRYFGVPFPVWYCEECGEVILAEEDQLPVDPSDQEPAKPCKCGSNSFLPEKDIFDTWATSSLTPQIAGRWLADSTLYGRVFPMSLRPQAHEIIRTWAFYTIVKSHFHFEVQPWQDILISGWGLAGEGMGKISKSRGGGLMSPMQTIERYSADAVRYWAASTSPGKDAVINEEKIQTGSKLVTKLWNVARFTERFLLDYLPATDKIDRGPRAPINLMTPADRWIISRTQRLICRATELFEGFDYAAAKSEIENFFWKELADNYLEMCKQRLYNETNPMRDGARFTLSYLLLTTIKLFAPFLPYVTDEIYQSLFSSLDLESTRSRSSTESGSSTSVCSVSIHTASWPIVDATFKDDHAEHVGRTLVDIATVVRRYKSEKNLPLGTDLHRLQLATRESSLSHPLREAVDDLMSITRARGVELVRKLDSDLVTMKANDYTTVAIEVVKPGE